MPLPRPRTTAFLPACHPRRESRPSCHPPPDSLSPCPASVQKRQHAAAQQYRSAWCCASQTAYPWAALQAVRVHPRKHPGEQLHPLPLRPGHAAANTTAAAAAATAGTVVVAVAVAADGGRDHMDRPRLACETAPDESADRERERERETHTHAHAHAHAHAKRGELHNSACTRASD